MLDLYFRLLDRLGEDENGLGMSGVPKEHRLFTEEEHKTLMWAVKNKYLHLDGMYGKFKKEQHA